MAFVEDFLALRRIVPAGSSNCAGWICGQTSKNIFAINTELLFSNVVGLRGGCALCPNLKCNCTVKLLDPELLNPIIPPSPLRCLRPCQAELIKEMRDAKEKARADPNPLKFIGLRV